MPKPSGYFLIFLASMTFAGGCLGGGCVGASRSHRDPGRVIYAPFPHHVAPTPDAASFRFAMVHDVIHERYPRHGAAYYAERERLAREKMTVLPRDSEAAFAFTDDIAVGLDRRGRADEAIALMRDKLARQQALGLEGKELYSTYANLGEFLVAAHMWAMGGGNAAAKARVQEGVDFTSKSLEVNPKAHFGREKWQLVAFDFLIDASQRPDLIRECDLIGNRLDRPIEIPKRQWRTAPYPEAEAIFGRPYIETFTFSLHYDNGRDEYAAGLRDPARRDTIRRHIYPVGGEAPPKESGNAKYGRRAPFDEPALWVIGEWRQGSGPSPHLALCLGEIMLRVGQRYLAWDCYERAARMADRFSPREELQQFLRTHCQARQEVIEGSLPSDEVLGLRSKFAAELAFGVAYQREYQAYEEHKIQAGENLNDEHFYDDFHAARGTIASKLGPEEWYAGEIRGGNVSTELRVFWQWGLLSGGACLLLAAVIATWIYRSRPGLVVTAVTPPLSRNSESPPASSAPVH